MVKWLNGLWLKIDSEADESNRTKVKFRRHLCVIQSLALIRIGYFINMRISTGTAIGCFIRHNFLAGN